MKNENESDNILQTQQMEKIGWCQWESHTKCSLTGQVVRYKMILLIQHNFCSDFKTSQSYSPLSNAPTVPALAGACYQSSSAGFLEIRKCQGVKTEVCIYNAVSE